MSETPITPPPDAAPAKSDRGWVWWCSDESIERRQISLLAVVEIPCAMAFFWWLSSISPWPWMTLVGLMAAPMLLLRSPASIEDGVARLTVYANRKSLSRLGWVTVFVVSAGVSFVASYWPAHVLIGDNTGFMLLFSSAALGAFSVSVASIVASISFGCVVGSVILSVNNSGTGSHAYIVAGSIAGATVVVLATYVSEVADIAIALIGVAVGTFAIASDRSRPKNDSKNILVSLVIGFVVAGLLAYFGGSILKIFFGFLFCTTIAYALAVSSVGVGAVNRSMVHPGIYIGIFCKILCIRISSTLRYWSDGLSELQNNWKETILSIDARHLPELLPQAGRVSPVFTLNGMLDLTSSDVFAVKDTLFRNLIFDLFMIMLIYFPAFLYRWNLKSSALLWGPISYVLSPIVWDRDETMRRTTARRTSWPLQKLLVWLLFGAGVWLLLPFLQNGLQETLPDKFLKLCTNYSAPPIGLRYLLLWAVWFSLSGLLVGAYWIRAPYDGALSHPDQYREKYTDEDKAEFKGLATSVQRWLNATLAITVLTVWVFALWWALQKWPEQLHNVVWNWIRPWL